MIGGGRGVAPAGLVVGAGEDLPTSPEGLPLLVTVEKAAQLLRIGRTKFYELLRSGTVTSVRFCRRRLVVHSSLEAFVAGLTPDQGWR